MAEPQTTRSEPQTEAILAAAAAGTLASEGEAPQAPGLTRRAASAISGFMGWLRDRDANPAAWMIEPLERRGIARSSLTDIIEQERARHREHLRRMEQRLQRDVPKALEQVDAIQRMRQILERERRWLRMHEEAAATRVEGAARKREMKTLSPRGAFWVMSPLVKNHTPDCEALALVGWWPWEALDLLPGPPNHPGCRCFLLTEDEARVAGLLGETLPSTDGAVARMRGILKTYELVQESRWREERSPELELQENLRDHAERELEKAGLTSEDADYGEMMADAVLEIIDVFREQGHSGGSAGMLVAILEKLLRYEPLTPLTSDPEDWVHVGGAGSAHPDTPDLWQNRRQPSAFSKDGGKSWELLEASFERVVRTAIDLVEGAEHSTVMVALYPSPELATQLAMKGGEESKELHVTLTFHGEAEKLGDPEKMIEVVREWAENTPVFEGEISGWGRFEAGPKPVTYMSIDVPHLSEHRERLAQALRDADLPPDDTHGFTPHMTVDYKRRKPDIEEGIPITFDRVTIAWASEHYSFPLGTSLEEMLAIDLEEVLWDRRYKRGTIWGGRFMPKRGGFAPRIGLVDILRELGGDLSVVARGAQRKQLSVPDTPNTPGDGFLRGVFADRNDRSRAPGIPTPEVPGGDMPGNPFGDDGRGRPGIDQVLDSVANRARELADEHGAAINLRSIDIDREMDDTAGHRSWDGAVRVGPEAELNIARAQQVVAENGRLDDDTAGGVYHAYRTLMHEIVHGVNPQSQRSYSRPADRNLEEAITEEMAHDMTVDLLREHGQTEALSWAQRHPGSLRAQGVYRPQRAALVAVLDDAEIPLPERRELLRSMAFDIDPDTRIDHLADKLAARNGMDKAMARDRIRGLMERMDQHDPLAPGARVLTPDNPPEGNEVGYRVGARVRVGGRDEPWEGTIRDVTVGEDGRFYPEVEVKHEDGSTTWRYPDPDDVDVTKEAPRKRLKKDSENVTGPVREGDRVRIKERNGDITVGQLRALHGDDALGWSGEVVTDEGEVVVVRPSSIADMQKARQSSRSRKRAPDGAEPPEPPPPPGSGDGAAQSATDASQQPVEALDEELDYSGGSFDARRYQDPRRSLNRKLRALNPGDKVLMADGTEMERGQHGDSVAIRRPDGTRRWYPSVHRATNAEIRGIEERHGVGGRSQALKDDTIAGSAPKVTPDLPDPDPELSPAEQKDLDDIAKGQASPAIVRKITDTLGFDPYDVDLDKLSEHAELHRRKPRTRMREGSPCARKRDIDFAVHFALPAMLQEKYPNAARWLARTSPRWGESHHGEDGHAPLPDPLNRPSLGQASPADRARSIDPRTGQASPAVVKEAHLEMVQKERQKWYPDHEPPTAEQATAHMAKLMKDAQIAISLEPDALDAVLDEGRFRSGVELGRSGQDPAMSPEDVEGYLAERGEWELATWGAHPIYGYWFDPTEENPKHEFYGRVRVVLKPSVNERSHYTVGDSLNEQETVASAAYGTAHPYVYTPEMRDPLSRQTLGDLSRRGDYVEAQIFDDGPSVEEIDRVLFLAEPPAGMKKRLEEVGVPYEVQPLKPSGPKPSEGPAGDASGGFTQEERGLVDEVLYRRYGDAEWVSQLLDDPSSVDPGVKAEAADHLASQEYSNDNAKTTAESAIAKLRPPSSAPGTPPPEVVARKVEELAGDRVLYEDLPEGSWFVYADVEGKPTTMYAKKLAEGKEVHRASGVTRDNFGMYEGARVFPAESQTQAEAMGMPAGQASPAIPDRTPDMEAAGVTDVEGVKVRGGTIHVGEQDGQLKVWDEEAGEPVDAAAWIDQQNPDQWLGERDYAADFWEHGPDELFHATDPANVDAILRDGLQARNETRGMANQSVGGGVFTSPNPSTLEHYGEGRVRIDVKKMREDGFDIDVTGEPPMMEAQQRNALAWELGLDSYDATERHPDLDPETTIFLGDVPAEYLGQASPSEWGDAARKAGKTRKEREQGIVGRLRDAQASSATDRDGQASPAIANLTPQERQAAEDWFDYDRAFIVKAASRGEAKPERGMDGEPVTAAEWIRAQQDANLLQGLAERNDSGYQQLQRGETWDDPTEPLRRYSPGSKVTLDALTAASPDPEIADIYTDIEITGGEGRAVLLDIESWETLPGFERHEGAEVILPSGLELEVGEVLDEPGQPLRVRLIHGGDGGGMWSPSTRGSGRSAERREQALAENPPRPVRGIPVYDGSELTDLKAAGGSNGARFAEDPEGNRWLVKRYQGDQDRIATELLSNSIYREMGVRVPNAGIAEVPDKDGKMGSALAYPLVDGEERPWSRPSGALADGFVVDALLANWDVVGLGMDNVLWDGEDPIRVDQGGTLQFRAMGQTKPFGPVPTELWTMNKPGGQAFRRMEISDELLRTGAADAADRLTPERIDRLVDETPFEDERMREEVRGALKERVGWLARFARGEEALPEPLEGQEIANHLEDRDQDLLLDPETEDALGSYLTSPEAVDERLRTMKPSGKGGFNWGKPRQQELTAEDEVIERLDELLAADETEVDEEMIVYLPTTGISDTRHLDSVIGKWTNQRSYLRAQFAPTEGAYIKLTLAEGAHAVADGGGGVLLPRGQKLHIVGKSGPGVYEAAASGR